MTMDSYPNWEKCTFQPLCSAVEECKHIRDFLESWSVWSLKTFLSVESLLDNRKWPTYKAPTSLNTQYFLFQFLSHFMSVYVLKFQWLYLSHLVHVLYIWCACSTHKPCSLSFLFLSFLFSLSLIITCVWVNVPANPWWSIETFGMPILSPGGQNDRKCSTTRAILAHSNDAQVNHWTGSCPVHPHCLINLYSVHFFSVILVVYCLVCPPHVLWFCLFFCLFRYYCESPSLLWLFYFSVTVMGQSTAACSENSHFPPIPSNQPPLPSANHGCWTLLSPTTLGITCDVACLLFLFVNAKN